MQLNQYGLRPEQTSTFSNALTIGTSFQQIAVNNPTRLTGFFLNVSTASIFILPTPNVSIGNGIELIPSGGFFKVTQWEDVGFAGYPWYAIATAINSKMLFIETNYNNLTP